MCKDAPFLNNEISDNALVLRVRENDNDAYKILLERYSSMINGIVSKYSAKSDREDLYQEASISFYYAAQFFDFQSSTFKTFASVCVERGVITALRKTEAKKRVPLGLVVSLSEKDEVVTREGDPERMFLEREAHEEVTEKIENHLSKLELSVLKVFLINGSYEQTAKELNLSRKSVDNALMRIRKKLDSLL